MTASCILLADPALLPNANGESRYIVWEGNLSASNTVSLTKILNEKLLQIRAEHMRWAYETGFISVKGMKLAEFLQADSRPSMWWTSLLYERHPKLSPNLYVIYKLRALELWLEEKNVKELELWGGDKSLQRSLANLCSAKGIVFSCNASKKASKSDGYLRHIYESIPAPARAILRFCHWWWTIRRKLPTINSLPAPFSSNAGSGKNAPATIVSYFPNIDLKAAARGRYVSRYWESLHSALNEEARKEGSESGHFVHWLFIRFPSPQLTFKQCRDLCKLFNDRKKDGLSFSYLESFITFREIARALKRWLKLCQRSIVAERIMHKNASFSGSAQNFWSYIKWEWAESVRGWRCLERSLQNEAFKRYCQFAGRQRWTLFPLENCPWERMLTLHARQVPESGPVYGVQHSIVRPTDFRYFDDERTFSDGIFSQLQPDIIGANGSSAFEQWRQNGIPENRSRILEALRYLYLARHEEPKNAEWNIPSEGEPVEPLGSKHLLVLTSFFKDETFAHLKLLEQALESGLLEDWQISLKAHPALSVSDWLTALPSRFQKKIMHIETPLPILFQSKQLVWTSNSTTAALEAAMEGLPLMVMAAYKDFDLCPIQNVSGLVRTATLDDVKMALKKPQSLKLPKDYLDLEPGLLAWKKLLGLKS